jgi:sodium/potassium/calcium exchanger 6
MGDLVADVAVARAGSPQMGIASCFGSPLLNIVLGLGIASTTYVIKHGTYTIDTASHNFAKVKLSWIFLGVALLTHLVVFPVANFRPPRLFGVLCVILYVTYILFSILQTLNIVESF